MNRFLAVIPLFPLALMSTACGSSCTTIGCDTHVQMTLAEAQEEEGVYEFQVSTNAEMFECTASIPASSDDTCDGLMTIEREEITTTSGDAVSGTAGDKIVGVYLSGEYGSLELIIEKDGQSLTEIELTPKYVGEEINGKGCGECPQAKHTIPIGG
ncbi:MAG: hypothetical protein MK135_08810 [Polyangiaceae bacterium]|nr:hypothetical protein [Polyangiaceae bacterium]